jgi:hypothetical protein
MAFDWSKCGSRTKFNTLVCGSCGRFTYDVDPVEFQKLFGYLPQKETAPGDDPGSTNPPKNLEVVWCFKRVRGFLVF